MSDVILKRGTDVTKVYGDTYAAAGLGLSVASSSRSLVPSTAGNHSSADEGGRLARTLGP